jgi:uncharacterized protein (UPF0262 family)
MGVIKYHPDLSNIKDLETFIKYASQAINQLHDIIGGSVNFDSNIASQTMSIKFNQANVEQVFTHSLNRKGLRYIVVDKSVACDVYHNAARDNISQIYLSCTVATTVTIILI